MDYEKMIEKYSDLQPYRSFDFSKDGRWIFYLARQGGAFQLRRLDTLRSVDLAEGEVICGEDFSGGTYRFLDFDEDRGWVYLLLDRDHRELVNLWRLDLRTGVLHRMTESHNDQGLVFSDDRRVVRGCDVRRSPDGTFQTTVYELDLLTGERTDLLSDDGWDYRIGWTSVVRADDEEALYLGVDYMSQRRRTNIIRWDLQSKTARRLLPEWLEEMGRPSHFARFVHEGRLYFSSYHEGFENLYELNIDSGEFRRRTRFEDRVQTMWMRRIGDQETLQSAFTEERDFWFEMQEADGRSRRWRLPAQGWILSHGESPWIHVSGSDHAPSLIRFDAATGEVLRRVSTLAVPSKEVENTRSEWVEYESFDGLRIPALLLRPKGPLRGALVVAFYGGEDVFVSLYQMFAEMGLAVLSPAVRGSWGWGREWEQRLAGDLGGAEIRDVHAAGSFVEKALGLEPRRIGVYGSSHGGYATLRALTYPDVAGLDPRYPFGFAIAEAGFADLEVFHRESRIADWLVHLLGPYRPEVYRERSPVTHIHRLRTPLLIINGTNDTRVPFSTMREFISKLKESDVPHRLLIHEGQGHHALTRETIRQDRGAMVEFLRDFVIEKRT